MSRRRFLAIASATLIVSFSTLISNASETTRTVVTTTDADYFGFDLRTERNVSLEQCEQTCVEDDICRAFTYNPKARWCFLKSDFETPNAFPGAIAGRVVEGGDDVDLGAPPALAFVSEAIRQQARDQKANLSLPDGYAGMGFAGLVGFAHSELSAGRPEGALSAYKAALSIEAEDPEIWLGAARAANRIVGNPDLRAEGVPLAFNAYLVSRTAGSRAGALVALAETLATTENYRAALSAYRESLALVEAAPVVAAYEDLRARYGFRVIDHSIDSDGVTPRACVQFSEPLVKRGIDYENFVLLDGKAPQAVSAKENQICVEGLVHGQRYQLLVRAGLPSSVDEDLPQAVNLDLYVRDRAPSVRFTGENFVLPSTARHGIPLVTINTDSVDLSLFRIGERGIAPMFAGGRFLNQLDGYDAERIEAETGEIVWKGTLETASDVNRDVVTSVPVDEILKERRPGVYVLTATIPSKPSEEWDSRATQWFVVSDIGLSTFAGTDGLSVFVRSLATAEPLEGVELQLLAKNNEILGTATSDKEGRAIFAAGLVRGEAALSPAVMTARKGEDDYVFLDMTKAGFDLSDRGVTGRLAPGAIDIFAWTERGIYRPGEAVHTAALARDGDASAIEGLPLTFIFARPDGVEYRRIVSKGGDLGGHFLELPLLANAMRGTWTVSVHADPKQSAIARKTFLVDDFVPDRIEFDLTSTDTEIEPGTPQSVAISGRYLYGAPAAGLSYEGEVTVRPTRTRQGFEGYQFGLVDEESSEDSRIPIDDAQPLDDAGNAVLDILVDEVPVTTQMLNAEIVVRLGDGGGRAVERKLVLPVRQDGQMIGIKPEFDGSVSENALARFHVLAVDSDGNRQEASGLRWKLLRLERNYQWYRDGTSWRFEPVVTTRQEADGLVDLTSDGAELSIPVSWGRYRLEVEGTSVDAPATSVEFDAGWYVEQASTETPDALEISLDRESYSVGETAVLKVSPRFAGKLLVTVGTDSLLTAIDATVDGEAAEVRLPVTEAWGGGTYITASLHRPGDAIESRMPSRAIGIVWAKVDPGSAKLSVELATPDKIEPRQSLSVPISVSGAGSDQEAYVVVAAVDVGILNLTRYETPDPDGWYFGQRRLGLELRDLYGQLIDGSLGAAGRIRTGGDGAQTPLQGDPPKEKLVAFFSGAIRLDADGKAEVSFDIPQFNGTVRLMAVAWSKQGVGHATRDVVVRDPVVISANLPRFMAPGDETEFRIELAATDVPSGGFDIALSSNSVLAIAPQDAMRTIELTSGKTAAITVPLSAVRAGGGTIDLALTNGSGLLLERRFDLRVRPAALPITERRELTLSPGATLAVDGELLSDSLLDDASISVNVTRASGLDPAAMLMSLDLYPYGCAEQTTSRALPLLYFNEIASMTGLPASKEIEKRVQDAIFRLLSFQSSSGSFGLWGPGYGDMWLDSYVTDFLTRAREKGYDVPAEALVQALDNLQNQVGYGADIRVQGNSVAYALYVLARNRKAALSDLRYYVDTALNDFPTPLAKAHLAAALALYGDETRSKSVFLDAVQMSEQASITKISYDNANYGSPLRDAAAILALAAESRPVPPIVPELTRMVERDWKQKRYISTQELSWGLLAARALTAGDDAIKLAVDGTAHTGAYRTRLEGSAILSDALAITNEGTENVSVAITTVAAPAVPLAAGGGGFTINRGYYDMSGNEANISEASQNERYVVVLEVTESLDSPQQILITDLLPAGFEIDNPSLVDSAKLENFSWIGETETAHLEFRDDRFVAAIDRPQGNNDVISLAYVVRAVRPGTYEHPAAYVEDMYRPELQARTATGRMAVQARP
ncbi:alpha-2-macroglobulin family protein [Ciceribacter sp. L1K22]|uniref:alpha-2-macroglobulin family protein n=1 Tax=Ciceribacter sp. L1K22 TaxID=2820275 RepID=UPI001ABE3CFD|nr:alpha-2-macroglobulin family protein [Ciceribacter sp. L1K22]MBO3758258.1 alpha-2-macroglobulin family protein [Ciceribacter sp. L1K22]